MMILDKEEHREALLQLLKSSTFSGEQIEFVYGLQQSIKSAIIRNQGCPEVLSDAPQGALDADPGPTSDDTKRARIIEIKQALSDIGSQKIDAITVAVLTGDKTQLQALETQAQALRSELSTI